MKKTILKNTKAQQTVEVGKSVWGVMAFIGVIILLVGLFPDETREALGFEKRVIPSEDIPTVPVQPQVSVETKTATVGKCPTTEVTDLRARFDSFRNSTEDYTNVTLFLLQDKGLGFQDVTGTSGVTVAAGGAFEGVANITCGVPTMLYTVPRMNSGGSVQFKFTPTTESLRLDVHADKLKDADGKPVYVSEQGRVQFEVFDRNGNQLPIFRKALNYSTNATTYEGPNVVLFVKADTTNATISASAPNELIFTVRPRAIVADQEFGDKQAYVLLSADFEDYQHETNSKLWFDGIAVQKDGLQEGKTPEQMFTSLPGANKIAGSSTGSNLNTEEEVAFKLPGKIGPTSIDIKFSLLTENQISGTPSDIIFSLIALGNYRGADGTLKEGIITDDVATTFVMERQELTFDMA